MEVVIREELRLPKKACYQRDSVARVERVLGVEAWDRSAQRVLLLFALLKRALRTRQEVEVSVARGALRIRACAGSGGTVGAVETTEGSGSIRLIPVRDVELIANEPAAKHELVLALDPSQVVAD